MSKGVLNTSLTSSVFQISLKKLHDCGIAYQPRKFHISSANII